jgi:hypothetical protein
MLTVVLPEDLWAAEMKRWAMGKANGAGSVVRRLRR